MLTTWAAKSLAKVTAKIERLRVNGGGKILIAEKIAFEIWLWLDIKEPQLRDNRIVVHC